jgi:ribosome-associated toxin RatA of RatAB toxin-antitoxin module
MSDPDGPSCWTRRVSYLVRADRSTVFNLIAEVELWPALFRHIRSARVLRRSGRRRLIAVKSRWKGLPLAYTAIQTVDDDAFETTIQHVSPITRGSITTWSVSPADADADPTHSGVELRLAQTVTVPVPLVGGILATTFVGGRVARDLGRQMARRVQEIAEGGSLAGRD